MPGHRAIPSPAQPGHPERPGQPGRPGHPARPGHPERPGHRDGPVIRDGRAIRDGPAIRDGLVIRRSRAWLRASRRIRLGQAHCRTPAASDHAIPSRMSCSLASTSPKPNRRMIRSSTMAPPAMTSARPGCMTPSAARSSLV